MCQENSNNYWQLANVQEAAGKHSNNEVEENARVLKLLNLSNKFEFWRQKSVLPIGDPGSTTNTEVDAINAPSSAGCNNASARGSKALACAKGPLEVSLLF